ncbi:MAG: YiiX/YebB-like N1pC/P60 family cysteine hydrolase [Fusobacteriaceae bacterium]
MKKIVCALIFSWTFIGCSAITPKTQWQDIKELKNSWNKIQIGDIIVKNKTIHPLEWYGHIGVVVTDDTVGDYPQPFVGYQENGFKSWLNEKNRQVLVLRYKNFTEEFKEQFLKNVEKMKKSDYLVTLNRESEEFTYCSKYVWYLYYSTAKDLGYNLDIDRDGGFLILPYDVLEVDELEYVELL